jgi:hypothetical protein
VDDLILSDRVARPGVSADTPPILIASNVQVRNTRRTIPGNLEFDRADLRWIARQIARTLAGDYTVNQRFYDGDHWQSASGWIGPIPDPNDTGASEVIETIRKSFVSENVIKEVIDRKAQAAVGREPAWTWAPVRTLADGEAPNDEESALIQELNDAITAWWDTRGAHALFERAVIHGLLAGKGPLRLFLPSGFLGADGEIPPITTLADALDLIYADAPAPDECTVIVNGNTMERAGMYAYRDDDNKRVGEICFTRGIGKQARTILRAFSAQSSAAQASVLVGTSDSVVDGSDIEMDLGGRITIGQLEIDKLISEQIRTLQMLLNLNMTMAAENVKVAGFLERVILNGQMPGHIESDPSDPTNRAKDRWVKDDYQVGPGSINYIAGNLLYDKEGKIIGISNPQMQYRTPVPVDSFSGTRELVYASILGQAQQLHYLLASEQYASGESRKQARADFEASLRKTRAQLNIFGRWFLETLVTFGAWLMDDPHRYDTIRCVFDARIDPGPATTETIRAAIELYDDGVISREAAQTWSGVDDPDAMSAQIAKERAAGIMPPPKTQAMGSSTGGITPPNTQT